MSIRRSICIASAGAGSRRAAGGRSARFVRERRPEIVMAFLSYCTALTAARAAHTGAHVVFNQQTPMSAFLTDADYRWGAAGGAAVFTATSRLGYGAADLIIATSRGVADDLTSELRYQPRLGCGWCRIPSTSTPYGAAANR